MIDDFIQNMKAEQEMKNGQQRIQSLYYGHILRIGGMLEAISGSSELAFFFENITGKQIVEIVQQSRIHERGRLGGPICRNYG